MQLVQFSTGWETVDNVEGRRQNVLHAKVFGNLPANFFKGCHQLVSVKGNVETIGTGAFEGCGLTSVNLPSAARIGDWAFKDCTDLSSINLPSATHIGEAALKG